MSEASTRGVMAVVRGLFQSRPLRLSLSVVLLMLSVLFVADFLGLRGDQRDDLRNARALIAQSLAVQLSTLASSNNLDALESSVQAFVGHNEHVLAAALDEATGVRLASYGDLDRLDESRSRSSLSQLVVPILDGNETWGQVRVAFVPPRLWRQDLLWFGFVTFGCMVAYWLFLRKALIQLDPGRAVPRRVDSAFNLFAEGVVILDDELRIVMANAAAATLAETSGDLLVGHRLDDWPWVKESKDGEPFQAPWTTTLHSGLDIADKPLRLEVSDGDSRLFMVSCSLVGSAEDAQHGVLVTLDDMTAIEQKNQELARTLTELRRSQESITAKNRELEVLATRDPLTGLNNRRVLMENLEREFSKAQREETPLSCVMADIDHFKVINDTYGHAVGDDVIRAVSATLGMASREYDTVGRYGGEEFMLLLPGLNASEAADIAERLRSGVVKLADNAKLGVQKLSASFGVADLSSTAASGAALVDQADQALYSAKQGGRNRVVCFDPAIVPLRSPEGATEVSASRADTSVVRVKELEALVRQRNSDLDKLRQYDSLTGVPLRMLFLQRIDTEIQRSKRSDTTIGLMSFELRDLSRLVATFGHAASDALIVEFVSRIHDGLRSTDAVCEITVDHSLSRITANEYGVLLAELGNAEGAMPVIARLRRSLSEPFIIGDERVYIGANIGIALFQDKGETAEELLEVAGRVRAEAALSPEKVSHSFASEQLEVASHNYIRLEADLHDALERRELSVHYQPKFDVAERRISGMEALLRWNHSEQGFISPAEFIPVAESNGLIRSLYGFVLDESIGQMERWRELGFDDLCVSINISAVQLRDTLAVEETIATLVRRNLASHHLEIELTETAVIDNGERANVALRMLRDHGIKVSMDDFGTGYTSLAMLADLPLDTVKIDRSFVIAMEGSERSRAIVESVINMAHALKLRVVGEGIETNDQLATLAALGCNEIQGYLISRPLPADEFTTFLLQQRATRLRRA